MASTSGKTASRTLRVLLIEDDLDDALVVRRALPAVAGFALTHAKTAKTGLEAAQAGPFDVCLLDLRLPDGDGTNVCRQLRAGGFTGTIILVTSVRQESLVARAFEAGASNFIVKDVDYGNRLATEMNGLIEGNPHQGH